MRRRPIHASLYAKLALTLVALSAVLSVALILILRSSHQAYHLELHQQLFRSFAEQLLSEAQDPQRSGPDIERVLAHVRQLAMAKPGLAAYVLDRDGSITASSEPAAKLRRRSVETQPLSRFIEGPPRWPVTAENPLSDAGRAIFSVALIAPGTDRERYLYVVLSGQAEGDNDLRSPLTASYSMREAMLLGLGNIAGALLAALAVVWLITEPVGRLRQAMEAFDESGFHGPLRSFHRRRMVRDEIDRLGEIFESMASRITAQLEGLRRSDYMRRELFANVSHDLRTPLTAIHGYAESLLLRESLPEPDRKRYLEIIRRQAADLSRSVEEIMELAKLDAPEIRLDRREFALDGAIGDVLAELRPLFERKRLALQTDVAPVRMKGDPDLIGRAVMNLIDNAIRESREGGTVRVRAGVPAAGGIEIEVLDEGPGIPPDELEQIFLRFRRAGGVERAGGGAGLGLAIVRRIAESHNGTASAENRPEGGAVFRLRFPGA